jgi:hypothetical protein
MSVLKHLKTLQHISIIIQIIFRELVSSLLKSLSLKLFIGFLKFWSIFVVMWQHNVRCVCVAFCVGGVLDQGVLCGEVCWIRAFCVERCAGPGRFVWRGVLDQGVLCGEMCWTWAFCVERCAGPGRSVWRGVLDQGVLCGEMCWTRAFCVERCAGPGRSVWRGVLDLVQRTSPHRTSRHADILKFT